MRHVLVPLAAAALLLPLAAPAAGVVHAPADGCEGQGEALCLPWSDGDLELGGLFWNTFGATEVYDFDGDGDLELVAAGPGWMGTWSKSYLQPMIPGHAKLEFDVEASGGSRADGLCSDWYDIRAILLSPLDPLPFLDTLAGLAPVFPIDYYNDEVLAWQGQLRAGEHVTLDPLRARIINNPVAATYEDPEKKVWLAQHFTAIWVAYISADPQGCSFDNFVRTLDP